MRKFLLVGNFLAREFLAEVFGDFWDFWGFLAVGGFWGFCRVGGFEGGIGVMTLMLGH